MPEGLVLLTHHYYADGPAGAPHVSLAKLLQSNRQLPPLLERLAQYSRTYRLPYRIAETNSIYDEGQPGVSDTLGAALWGLELMFQAAAAGAAGVNFHGGVHNRRASDDKAYTPIARSGDRYRATPLYYSMLMFAQAARGALVPAHLAPDTSGLKAFAVRAPEGTLRVCLINQNITRDERVAIDPGRKFTVASMMRLAGPAIDATAGVTLGGASIDEFGRWAPPMNEEVRLTGQRSLSTCRRPVPHWYPCAGNLLSSQCGISSAQSAVELRLSKIAILHPREGAVTSSLPTLSLAALGVGASVPLASEDSQIGVRMQVCLYGQDRTKPEPSHKIFPIICCASWRSRGRTRCGRWTLPTSRWRAASSTSPWRSTDAVARSVEV